MLGLALREMSTPRQRQVPAKSGSAGKMSDSAPFLAGEAGIDQSFSALNTE
jgi:hypothetical protein